MVDIYTYIDTIIVRTLFSIRKQYITTHIIFLYENSKILRIEKVRANQSELYLYWL